MVVQRPSGQDVRMPEATTVWMVRLDRGHVDDDVRPRRGQKPRRPNSVSSVGSSVSPAIREEATPIAATGPSELVFLLSARDLG